jgi:hypothetical protein
MPLASYGTDDSSRVDGRNGHVSKPRRKGSMTA